MIEKYQRAKEKSQQSKEHYDRLIDKDEVIAQKRAELDRQKEKSQQSKERYDRLIENDEVIARKRAELDRLKEKYQQSKEHYDRLIDNDEGISQKRAELDRLNEKCQQSKEHYDRSKEHYDRLIDKDEGISRKRAELDQMIEKYQRAKETHWQSQERYDALIENDEGISRKRAELDQAKERHQHLIDSVKQIKSNLPKIIEHSVKVGSVLGTRMGDINNLIEQHGETLQEEDGVERTMRSLRDEIEDIVAQAQGPSVPSLPAETFVDFISKELHSDDVGLKIDDELMEMMWELGVVDDSGTDYGPNYSSSGIPPNRKPRDGETFDVEGLSLLFKYYKEGLKPADIVGLEQANARTGLSLAEIVSNALQGQMPSSATALYEEFIRNLPAIDKNLWDMCLKNDCIFVDGIDRPQVVLITLLKQDPKNTGSPRCFYGRGAYGDGGAAGQINRVPPNHSTYNKDPIALNWRWNTYGSKVITRNDGNIHRYGLWQADRIRVRVSELAQALANGYQIIGFGLGDWMHHIFNQVVNKNAYLPIYSSWALGGFMYHGYTGINVLSPFELARDAPTKSEMDIGAVRECSAGTHQAMLLGHAHVKQQVDCVEVRNVAHTVAPPRDVVTQIDNQILQPVFSMVYEGITTLIMSFNAERNFFNGNPGVAFNWV